MTKRFVQIKNNILLVCVTRCSNIKKSTVLWSICKLSVASVLLPSGCVVQAEILLTRIDIYWALFPGGCVTSHPAVPEGPHSGGASWATGASQVLSLQTPWVQKLCGKSVASDRWVWWWWLLSSLPICSTWSWITTWVVIYWPCSVNLRTSFQKIWQDSTLVKWCWPSIPSISFITCTGNHLGMCFMETTINVLKHSFQSPGARLCGEFGRLGSSLWLPRCGVPSWCLPGLLLCGSCCQLRSPCPLVSASHWLVLCPARPPELISWSPTEHWG